jgi:hypothetical protein
MIAGADARVMPIEFSAPMVRALLAGRKTETRRLVSSPLARVRRGDLLWVKEAVRIGREMPRSGGRTEVRFEYAADGTASAVDWPSRLARPAPGGRSARFVPPELSRITLRVEDARTQRLADIDDQSALAEGIVPCVWPDAGVRGYWVESFGNIWPEPRSAFLALWRELHGDPGSDAEANPEVIAIRFAVLRRPVASVVPALGHGGVR